MTKEEYVKVLISQAGHNVKSFAESIDLPYTTLLGMLNRGLGGASVHNVIKVCKGLSITIDELQQIDNAEKVKIPFYVSTHEETMITAYRKNAIMQSAVDKLLGIDGMLEKSPPQEVSKASDYEFTQDFDSMTEEDKKEVLYREYMKSHQEKTLSDSIPISQETKSKMA